MQVPRTVHSFLTTSMLALSILVGCGEDEATPSEPDAGADGSVGPGDDAGTDAAVEPDPSDELFRPDHVLEVEINLDPADFERLRNEPTDRGIPSSTCGHVETRTPYNYYPGTITIDGVVTADVGVRKKGNLGSLSSERPGLKVKANEYVDGQRIFGLKQLTLNNNAQDTSRISQCLGYGLFAAAGVPASRCSFAHVTVNGEDLGLYTNVESIKESFLERHFADGEGHLYESGGALVPGGTSGYQPKVDEENPDCSDLDTLVTALQVPDDELPAALETVLDVDEFLSYWAMEVITDHWDGYANNQNNYFLYHDPTSDRFHFIPWGVDALFEGRVRTTRPSSVFACASLPWRLYDVPATRDSYLARLTELLDTVWDEDALLAEIARMEALISSVAEPGTEDQRASAIEHTREFVRTRAGVLRAELDAGTPEWPYEAGEASCRIIVGTLTATFETVWDSLDVWNGGSGTMSGTISGVSLDSSTLYASAGPSDGASAILQVLSPLADGRYAVVWIGLHDVATLEAREMPLDLVNAFAVMSFYDPATDTASGGGLVFPGTLTLDEASTEPDAPIRGTVTGEVLEL